MSPFLGTVAAVGVPVSGGQGVPVFRDGVLFFAKVTFRAFLHVENGSVPTVEFPSRRRIVIPLIGKSPVWVMSSPRQATFSYINANAMANFPMKASLSAAIVIGDRMAATSQ
jgi:hypothetical protein